MKRPTIAILLFLSVVLMAACGGGSKTGATGAITTIDIAPSSLSLDAGQVSNVTAVAKDSKGTAVLSATITYASDKDLAVAGQVQVQVANNGAVCAGQWDSKTAPVVCTKSTSYGSANITATSGGVTSAIVVVSVHPKVTSVTVTTAVAGCTSQTQTQQFSAKAFDGSGTDVTALVGAFSWVTTNAAVGTVDANGLVTAAAPGQVDVIAQINGVNSLPAPFTTCSPASITLGVTGSNPLQTVVTLAPAGTSNLTATVTDTKGNPITTISTLYSSSSTNAATVVGSALTATVTAVGPGRTSIVASCTPPTCNSGVNTPVYSNIVDVTVTGTSSTTVYATAPNSTTIVPITTGTNVAGTALTVPQVTLNNVATTVLINSMVFAPNGNRAYIGADKAGLILDGGTNTFTPITNVQGSAMTVSPNNIFVVFNDAANTRVLVYNANTSAVDALPVNNPVAAAFSGDSSRLYLLAGSNLYVYDPPAAMITIPLSAAGNDVTGLSQGSLMYLAGGNAGAITARATCNNNQVSSTGTAATPLKITSNSDSTRVFAADTTNLYDVAVTQGSSACPPAPINALSTTALGATVAPSELLVTSDGTQVFVVANQAFVLDYNTAGKTVSNIALTGGGTTLGSGLTSDGAQLWVGASTNDVHFINTATKADAAQVAVSLKQADNTVLAPSIIAVRPR